MSEIVKPEPKTREWVEGWRVALDATYMADNLPTRKAREDVHILCDMALKSLDFITALENARKDAWLECREEAAKLASTEAARVGQLGPEGHTFWQSHEATAMITLSNLEVDILALTPPSLSAAQALDDLRMAVESGEYEVTS